jgi:hypothetical protein
MKRNYNLIIAAVVIAVSVTAVIMYFFMSGFSLTATPDGAQGQTTGGGAGLVVTMFPAEFDHRAAVRSDGSVSTDHRDSVTLTIENPDDMVAQDVRVMLENPRTNVGTLHDELETDKTVFSIGGGATHKIYNGHYITGGYRVGDIQPGGAVDLTFVSIVERCGANTFDDGDRYDCLLYVHQPVYDTVATISFRVRT